MLRVRVGIVPLVNGHSMRLRRIILSSVLYAALPYLPIYHERHDFRKNKILNIKCVFQVSLQILPETFLIPRVIKRDITVNVHGYSRNCLQNFKKLEFSRQIFEKYSNIKFDKDSPSWSPAAPCRRTDGQANRHEEADSRFSQFLESA